jgi:hypothetical protein
MFQRWSTKKSNDWDKDINKPIFTSSTPRNQNQNQTPTATSWQTLKEVQQSVPSDPQRFYEDFGLLTHPRTQQPVSKLTAYQYEIWKHESKYKLVVKSQKVGLSTSELLHDFQLALTKCKGQDILIIAQTLQHAREHLNTLKFLIVNSQKYSPFLINSPEEMLFREMQTKIGVAYIKNPENPSKPTRIIALGSKEGAVWSWKNVAHIHMSDVAVSTQVDDSGLFAAAFSRLANTNGTMTIETPPHGMDNQVYKIYMQSRMKTTTDLDSPESQFKIFQVPAREAVAAGLITQEFLDAEKERFGPLYPRYYEAEFIAGGGNVYNLDAIEAAQAEGQKYGYVVREDVFYSTSLGIDPGYGSSKFGMVVSQFVGDGEKIRIIHAKEYEHPDYHAMVEEAYYLISKYRVDLTYVDGSNPEFIKSLKLMIGEPAADYHERLQEAKKQGLKPSDIMKIVPVTFATENREMLQHSKHLVEDRRLCIHPDFQSLLDQMRAAVAIDGKLDKSIYTHDLLDAFQLALNFYKFEQI